MTTYTLRVDVEPDEDSWHAYCPALRSYGAATWGRTREEALGNIREVAEMVVAKLIEDGELVPADVQVSEEPLVSITVRARSIERASDRSAPGSSSARSSATASPSTPGGAATSATVTPTAGG